MPTAEPVIACPKCKTEIKLTESLAAPLLEASRREFAQRLADKDAECVQRDVDLRHREHLFALQKETFAAQAQEKLKQEREKIAAEELRKARAVLALEIEGKSREIDALQDILQQREGKLAEAQKTQAQFLQAQRALADEKREFDLTLERRLSEESAKIRAQARRDAEEHLKLKVLEREQTIAAMQRQIEDLRRKAEQGSQQLQGEAQELQLESLLNARFPFDLIAPVRKGEHGGDVLQQVRSAGGGYCGTILWETKCTKTWSDSWLAKLRADQRAAKAEVAVLVSQALPKDIETFEFVDGVWVTHPKTIFPVALSLRHMLLEIATVRHSSEGQQTKAEMIYQYLTGSRFRLRVQAIVEAFSAMQQDLDRERKVMLKQWAKRQEQIERVMQATVGMYGDLQGIAGKTLGEIEGLDIEALPLIA